MGTAGGLGRGAGAAGGLGGAGLTAGVGAADAAGGVVVRGGGSALGARCPGAPALGTELERDAKSPRCAPSCGAGGRTPALCREPGFAGETNKRVVIFSSSVILELSVIVALSEAGGLSVKEEAHLQCLMEVK